MFPMLKFSNVRKHSFISKLYQQRLFFFYLVTQPQSHPIGITIIIIKTLERIEMKLVTYKQVLECITMNTLPNNNNVTVLWYWVSQFAAFLNVSLGVPVRHIPVRIIGCHNSPHSCTYHRVSQFATFHWVSQFATFLYVSLSLPIRHIHVRIIGCRNSPHSCTYHWVSQFATFLYVSLGYDSV